MSYFAFFVGYLYISGSGSFTSVGEERANLSAIVVIMWFLLERFTLLLGAWNGLHYFIVTLPEPSTYLLTVFIFTVHDPVNVHECL